MGHAGAIIAGGKGTAQEKMEAMRRAGIHVVENPALIGETLEALLEKRGAKVTQKSSGKNVRSRTKKGKTPRRHKR
jgi:succinyl-CoA synthetase alpha subunit